MYISMIARMKELEGENRRYKEMYLEEKLKSEIVAKALAKSGDAFPPTRDGPTCRSGT